KIAYTGYDWTKDTWIDSKLYVMNSDGSNPHLVSGDWDRSPSALRWSADGNGIYFTASSEGSENFYYLPLAGAGAGKVTAITKGAHMLAVSDMNAKGKAVGILNTPSKPGDVVSFDVRNPSEIKQPTAVNDDVLAGRKLGKVQDFWYTST